MSSTARYDRIGRTYGQTRRTEPRIARRIHEALGAAASVLNVGAGTGSYEPADRFVVAVEPSIEMLSQRALDAAPAIRGVAEALPFPDDAFEAAMGVLTMHHWRDLGAGLAEVRRVARRQVFLMFEPSWADQAWIVADYFPEMLDLESERNAPGVADVAEHLDVVSSEPVPVPSDCVDGFAGSFWNRPDAYLDPDVQAGMSSLAQLDPETLGRGIERLRAELASGAWDRKYGHLRTLDEHHLGYYLIVAE